MVTKIVFWSTAEYVLPISSLSLLRHPYTRSATPAGVIQPYAMGSSVSVGLPTSPSEAMSFRGGHRKTRWSRPCFEDR